MLFVTQWWYDRNIGLVHLGKWIWTVVRKKVNQEIVTKEKSRKDKN